MTRTEFIADMICFAVIPPQNPTVPTAVSSLGAMSVPGGINFAWNEPAVIPRGTEYRLMEAAANSYGAAAPVWRGAAYQTLLARPNTATNYYWLDSVANHGSYSTFPGVGSGVPAYALLADTANLQPEAATKIITINTPASVSSFVGASNVIVNSVGVGGTFEIALTGRVTCVAFGLADYFASLVSVSGSGTITPNGGVQQYRVVSSGQQFSINHLATFITQGSGPWRVNGTLADLGGGSVFTAADLALRTTVVRR